MAETLTALTWTSPAAESVERQRIAATRGEAITQPFARASGSSKDITGHTVTVRFARTDKARTSLKITATVSSESAFSLSLSSANTTTLACGTWNWQAWDETDNEMISHGLLVLSENFDIAEEGETPLLELYVPLTRTITINGTGYDLSENRSWTISAGGLGATTVGQAFFTLANPSAITFPRINANNTVSALDAATFRSAIGAGTSSFDGVYSSLSGIPSTFAPSSHTHPWSQVTSTPTTISGYGITDGVTLTGTQTITGAKTFQGVINFTGGISGGLALNDGDIETPGSVIGAIVQDTTAAATLSSAGVGVKTSGGSGGTITANATTSARTWNLPDASGTVALTSSNVATAAALANGRTISITGDLTYTSGSFDGSGNVTGAGTLATVNSNVGSFGSASAIPVITVNAKGLVTAVSTASVSGGTKTVEIQAGAMKPFTTNGASSYPYDNANGFPFDALSFSNAADQSAGFDFILPTNYTTAATVTVKVYWKATSGTMTDSVKWNIAFRANADGDANNFTFGTAGSVTDTPASSDTDRISSATGAITIGGSPAAGQLCYGKITRDTSVANNLAAAAILDRIEVTYT